MRRQSVRDITVRFGTCQVEIGTMSQAFAQRRTRGWTVASGVVAICAWLIVRWLAAPRGGGIPPLSEVPFSPIGTAGVPWREMSVKWRTPVGQDEPAGFQFRELLRDKHRIYYAGTQSIGAVSAGDGQILWAASLAPHRVGNYYPCTDRNHRIGLGGSVLVACETTDRIERHLLPYRISAYEPASGRRLWSVHIPDAPNDAPVVAQDRVYIGTLSGSLVALRASDGRLIWKRPLTSEKPSERKSLAVLLHPAGSIGVAEIGDSTVAGVRLDDGRKLWTIETQEPNGGFPGASHCLVDGRTAYLLGLENEVSALDVRTGRRLWRRRDLPTMEPAGSMVVAGSRLLLSVHAGIVMLDKASGRTMSRPSGTNAGVFIARSSVESSFLARTKSAPRLDQVSRNSLSVPGLDTLTAIDPTTGRALWCWQPQDGIDLTTVLPVRDRLVVPIGSTLVAYSTGTLPIVNAASGGRQQIARSAIDRLFAGKSGFGDGWSGVPDEQERNALCLQILRLGPDSVLPLIDELRAAASRAETAPPSALQSKPRSLRYSNGYPSISDLLTDIGDPRSSAAMIDLLDHVRRPESRDDLAKALVRFGDLRAAPLLFRYAQDTNAPPDLRLAALAVVCHSGPAGGVGSNAVTVYLLRALDDRQGPSWLRRFAMLELNRDRGVAAHAAAQRALRTTRGHENAVGKRPEGSPQATETTDIYQAALAAMRAAGCTRLEGHEANEIADRVPVMFANAETLPLFSAFPSDEKGTPSDERNPGAINQRLLQWIQTRPALSRMPGRFARPTVALNGEWDRQAIRPDADPIASIDWQSRKSVTFADFFPYELSPDGRRARIGWYEDDSLFMGSAARGFDVEVLKVGGEWLPVECRPIEYERLAGGLVPLAPIRTPRRL